LCPKRFALNVLLLGMAINFSPSNLERNMSGKHRKMEYHVKEQQTAEMPNDDTAREEEEPQEPVAAVPAAAAGGGGRASVETHLGGDSEPVIEQGEHGQ
jgi:hypothetical protein